MTREFPSEREVAAFCQHTVQLAQVIEHQFRLRRARAQLLEFMARVQVSEQTVADAVLRDVTQLLFHALERVAEYECIGVADFQQHGMDGREPPDGPRNVERVVDLLAAMAFQVHNATAAGPFVEGQREGSEQHVRDLRVIDGRHFVQQSFCLFSAQTDGDRLRRAGAVVAVCIVKGQWHDLTP